MLGWLNSIFSWAFSGLDDLWKKVVGVFQTILSWTQNYINQVIGDINGVWQWITNAIAIIERWVGATYTAVTHWVENLYTQLIAWIGREVTSILNFINSVMAWTSQWIARIYNDVRSWLSSLEAWVIANIWAPLYNLVSGALRWIETEGKWVLYLLTHPDQLALILGRYILSSWMGLGHKYAKPVARWMIHTMISAAGETAGILEDFIAGIL
jgi:hypothetical protein